MWIGFNWTDVDDCTIIYLFIHLHKINASRHAPDIMVVQGNGKSTHWIFLGLAWHTAVSKQVCWITTASPVFWETKPEGWRVPGQTRLSIPWPKTAKAILLISGTVPWALYFQKVLKTAARFRPIMKTNSLNCEFGTETRGDQRWEDCRDEETKLLHGLTQRVKGRVLKNAVFWVHLKTIKWHNNDRGSMDLKGWSAPIFKWILKRTDKGRFAVEQSGGRQQGQQAALAAGSRWGPNEPSIPPGMLPIEPRVCTRSSLVSEVAKKSNTSAAIKELARSRAVEEERSV